MKSFMGIIDADKNVDPKELAEKFQGLILIVIFLVLVRMLE